MECFECFGNLIQDYQSGDIICRNCGLVQNLQICPNNDAVFEDEVNPGSDELIIHMVLLYGFSDGMITLIEGKYEDYKRKLMKKRVYKKEYIVASLIMQMTNSNDYRKFSLIYDLDIKQLQDMHYNMNE